MKDNELLKVRNKEDIKVEMQNITHTKLDTGDAERSESATLNNSGSHPQILCPEDDKLLNEHIKSFDKIDLPQTAQTPRPDGH